MHKLNTAIITIFPDMIQCCEYGIIGKAMDKGILSIQAINPRDHAINAYGTIDDRPYGGGPGMIMRPEPLKASIAQAKTKLGQDTIVINLSPQGKQLTQDGVRYLYEQQNLIFIAGRYQGIDERIIRNEVDEQWSIGDYVISGGELACMVIIDAMTRLHPDALGNEASKAEESFTHGIFEHPHYTRPAEFEGHKVPQVLLDGNHQDIQEWRKSMALANTSKARPELLSCDPKDKAPNKA